MTLIIPPEGTLIMVKPRYAAQPDRRRPAKARPVAKNGSNVSDKRLSVCVPCRKGIFEGHDYHWTPNGLIHDWCEEVE